MTDTEQRLALAKDVLMAVALATGVATGVAAVRLAAQSPDGAVAEETGTVPAPETPPAAARLQRAIGALSTVNIASGVTLVAVNGVMSQGNYSHPPARRSLAATGSGAVSPAWVSAGLAALGAGIDQGRRQLT